MNAAEFKAWFDGFCEGVDGAPTEKQWKRVCEKVSGVVPNAPPTSYATFVHQYPWWLGLRDRVYYSHGTGQLNDGLVRSFNQAMAVTDQVTGADAFRVVGRREASS